MSTGEPSCEMFEGSHSTDHPAGRVPPWRTSRWSLGAVACCLLAATAGCGAESDTPGGAARGGDDSVARAEAELTLPGNRRMLGYYTQWSIYGGHGTYNPCSVPFTKYTHINYAFVGVRKTANPSYSVPGAPSANPYAATPPVARDAANYEGHFKWLKPLDYHADEGHANCSNQSFRDGQGVGPVAYGGAYGGNVGLFRRAKEVYGGLKFIISFGGWTKGAGFPVVAADATKRGEFCDDVVRIVRRFSADGADFDWEYPGEARAPDPNDSNDEGVPGGGPADTANFTALLGVCRAKLTAAGVADGKPYELTAAVSAGRAKLDKIDWAAIVSQNLLTHVNVMTYDFHGAFEAKVGHQSALYASPGDTFPAPFNAEYNVDFAFRYLTGASPVIPGNKGFPASKTSIGMAFYTRGWNAVAGGVDVDGNGSIDGLFGSGGSALAGTWGPGGQNGLNKIYELKQASGWEEIWDNAAKAHVLYNRAQGALYTYDSVRSIEEKVAYCKDPSKNCGGMFNWEIDGDAYLGGQSYPLTTRAVELLAAGGCTPSASCPTNSCGSMPDGCGGVLACGSCGAGLACSANQCLPACTPATCASAGAACGAVDDGCGGALACGSCGAGFSCNANQCVPVAPDTAAPSAPASATASGATASQIALSWPPSADNTGVAGYRLYRNGIQVATAAGTSYVFTGLAPASAYSLGVSAFDAAGNASATTTAALATTSGTCAGVRVYQSASYGGYGVCLTAGDYGAAALAARGVNDNDIASARVPSGYSMTLYELDDLAGASLVKSADDSSLANDPLGAGNWSDAPSSLRVVAAGGDTSPPTTPAALTTSGATASQIALSWTASTDNVGVSAYEIYRDGALVTTTTGTAYTFTGLTASTAYTLGVKAKDAAGNASALATKGASTAAASGGNCGAPGWSSSAGYSKGSLVKEPCVWANVCSAADLNKSFAWRCDATVAGYCSAYKPGAVNSIWSGIWTKLEACP